MKGLTTYTEARTMLDSLSQEERERLALQVAIAYSQVSAPRLDTTNEGVLLVMVGIVAALIARCSVRVKLVPDEGKVRIRFFPKESGGKP